MLQGTMYNGVAIGWNIFNSLEDASKFWKRCRKDDFFATIEEYIDAVKDFFNPTTKSRNGRSFGSVVHDGSEYDVVVDDENAWWLAMSRDKSILFGYDIDNEHIFMRYKHEILLVDNSFYCLPIDDMMYISNTGDFNGEELEFPLERF